MPSLWFVMPAHGRLELARICMGQLRRTCDALTDMGVEATAVVVACDENLDTARALGFGTIERDNRFLSRRFNDGIQLATDPQFNARPATHVVPIGSDDWVDMGLFVDLPGPNTMVGFPHMSFVREDGRDLQAVTIGYEGGAGIRVWPRALIARMRYRPADEDRVRGCDSSILINTQKDVGVHVEHRHTDPRQIVDWKSHDQQVNPYESVTARFRGRTLGDPFEALADLYPAEALDEMAAHYGLVVA